MNKTIEFKWWSHSTHELNEDQKTELTLHAMEQANALIKQGFCQGDLSTGFTTEDGDVEYQGWWKIRDNSE